MGVIEYNNESTDIEEAIEYNENEIIEKLDIIQNQISELFVILKDIKKDVEQLKK